MPPRPLPEHPDFEHLRKQAKRLLRQLHTGEPRALERLRSLDSPPAPERATLADAQHLIAREYGFPSWPRLKARVDEMRRGGDPAAALSAAVKANDAREVARVLELHPQLGSALDQPMAGAAFGGTPLLEAVHRANREMIDVLLLAGADINARSHWWAGSFGVLDHEGGLASFLIQRGAVVDVHAAARLGMIDRLDALVSVHPHLVHARGGDGQTPLHFASSIPVAEYLLEHGADIDARDIDHESTPAQYMVRERQDVARYLVARGCRTDILMAAALGDLSLVRRHLDDDPGCVCTSVSERDFPKQDARSGGTIYIWTLGAHQTPHLVARDFGHREVLQVLLERSPLELKLALAGELGDQKLLQTLLQAHPNLVRTLSDEDRGRLAAAAQSNKTEAVRLMLDAGWPVDVRGPHGGTALHWAAWHGNLDMITDILRHRPQLELRDQDYDGTALGWAIHASRHGGHPEAGSYAAVVEALLRAGAEVRSLPEDFDASDAVRAVVQRHSRA